MDLSSAGGSLPEQALFHNGFSSDSIISLKKKIIATDSLITIFNSMKKKCNEQEKSIKEMDKQNELLQNNHKNLLIEHMSLNTKYDETKDKLSSLEKQYALIENSEKALQSHNSQLQELVMNHEIKLSSIQLNADNVKTKHQQKFEELKLKHEKEHKDLIEKLVAAESKIKLLTKQLNKPTSPDKMCHDLSLKKVKNAVHAPFEDLKEDVKSPLSCASDSGMSSCISEDAKFLTSRTPSMEDLSYAFTPTSLTDHDKFMNISKSPTIPKTRSIGTDPILFRKDVGVSTIVLQSKTTSTNTECNLTKSVGICTDIDDIVSDEEISNILKKFQSVKMISPIPWNKNDDLDNRIQERKSLKNISKTKSMIANKRYIKNIALMKKDLIFQKGFFTKKIKMLEVKLKNMQESCSGFINNSILSEDCSSQCKRASKNCVTCDNRFKDDFKRVECKTNLDKNEIKDRLDNNAMNCNNLNEVDKLHNSNMISKESEDNNINKSVNSMNKNKKKIKPKKRPSLLEEIFGDNCDSVSGDFYNDYMSKKSIDECTPVKSNKIDQKANEIIKDDKERNILVVKRRSEQFDDPPPSKIRRIAQKSVENVANKNIEIIENNLNINPNIDIEKIKLSLKKQKVAEVKTKFKQPVRKSTRVATQNSVKNLFMTSFKPRESIDENLQSEMENNIMKVNITKESSLSVNVIEKELHKNEENNKDDPNICDSFINKEHIDNENKNNNVIVNSIKNNSDSLSSNEGCNKEKEYENNINLNISPNEEYNNLYNNEEDVTDLSNQEKDVLLNKNYINLNNQSASAKNTHIKNIDLRLNNSFTNSQQECKEAYRENNVNNPNLDDLATKDYNIFKDLVKAYLYNNKKIVKTLVNETDEALKICELMAEYLTVTITTESLDNLISKIQQYDQIHLSIAVISFLMKHREGSGTLIHIPLLPNMEYTQQTCLCFLKKLNDNPPPHYNQGVFELIMKIIEYKLFNLNSPPNDLSERILTQFYAYICQVTKQCDRLRILCIDALYCMNFKALPVITIALNSWPYLLPGAKYQSANDPLVIVMVYIMINLSNKDTDKIDKLGMLLKKKYGYDLSNYNDDAILNMLMKSLNGVYNENSLKSAFLLYGKKCGANVCHKKILIETFVPLLDDQNVSLDNKIFIIKLIGPLTKPFPATMMLQCEIIVKKLIVILKSSDCHELGEAIIESLTYFSKKNYDGIMKEIVQWKPKAPISGKLLERLNVFIGERNFKFWIGKKY